MQMLSRSVLGGTAEGRQVRGVAVPQLPLMHCELVAQAPPSAAGGPQSMLGRQTSLVLELSQPTAVVHAWPFLGIGLQVMVEVTSQYEVVAQRPPVPQAAESAR